MVKVFLIMFTKILSENVLSHEIPSVLLLVFIKKHCNLLSKSYSKLHKLQLEFCKPSYKSIPRALRPSFLSSCFLQSFLVFEILSCGNSSLLYLRRNYLLEIF